MINKNSNTKLHFIHTPKCAGSYASNILKDLKIHNMGHNQAIKNKNIINFTIIRDPIERYESLLNYRLNRIRPDSD